VLRIGVHTFDTTTLLAPMAAVTDLPFRTVCEEHGVGLTITEFLSAEALVRGAHKNVDKLTASLGGRRFGVQIFGREAAPLQRAAEMAVSIGASLVDINMGCPAKRVVAGECGSALMKEPELAADIVRIVRQAVPADVPVTVKHRAGWDERHKNAAEFACALVEAGAAMITVHGRTRTQGFSGLSDLAIIRRVRDAVPAHIPVVGNGDVVDLATYERMRGETGVDAVMIGRGALGNPFLFADIAELERGGQPLAAPSVAERHAAFVRHVQLIQELIASGRSATPHHEQRGSGSPEDRRHRRLVVELRKACAWYGKGMHGGAELRKRAWAATSASEVLAAANDFWRNFTARPHERAPLESQKSEAA
jgi:tRNA-dihydrouridine synthase B